jgi:hypothetical protein
MRRDAEMPVLAERTQSGQGANLRQNKLIEDAEPDKTKAGYKDCTTHLTATAGNKKVGQTAEKPPAVLEGNQSHQPKFNCVQAEINAIHAVLPASMVSTLPVMLRPPSPSRYSTMRATSSVSGSRRNALRPAIRLR